MDSRPICLESFTVTSIKFTYALVSLSSEEQAVQANLSWLRAALSLSHTHLDWPLLEVVVSFWDPTGIVFCFGKHELTPTIEELEYFLGLKHCHHTEVIFPVHKSNYFKDFWLAINVSKAFLPKEISGDFLHCIFNLLLDRGWKKVEDFSDLAKFKAFTLMVLGQLLLSHSQHHISRVLCSILGQLFEGKTLAPIIIVETISSLSHCAQQRNGQLYGCPAFLQTSLYGHISSLPSSIPHQVILVQAPSRKKALIDYQGIFVGLPSEHIVWQAKSYKAHYPCLFFREPHVHHPHRAISEYALCADSSAPLIDSSSRFV